MAIKFQNIKRLITGTTVAICLLTSPALHAQNSVEVVINKDGEAKKEIIELPKSMTFPLDSMLNEWKVKKYIDLSKDCKTEQQNPYFSDSVYIQRLSMLPNVMEMPYNEIIRKFIDLYAVRLRDRVSLMLGVCNLYIPIFEEALDAYNLPLELKYLPVIESALNPSAVSRVGASGLWQFMLGTGKLYGLETNSYVDERLDPIKSTWAAARYLRDLYNMYKDWNLVIAAYNCGPGNINKAIKRAGGNSDYWAIYNYLPKETRGYVPSFIAANYIMTYYCKHNICPMETSTPQVTDTVQVSKNIHLDQIAHVCNIDLRELKSLNPQYRRNIIPGETGLQTLRLPQNFVGCFIEHEDSIYNYNRDQYFSNRKIVKVEEKVGKGRSRGYSGGSTTYHKIRSGETLGTIARKYGVTVSQLKRWNNLKGHNIRAGKRLKICK